MHVIIVEDEPAILRRLERQVSELMGEKLDKLKCFSNLNDAQDYINHQAIDLLFLDLNLRGENGFNMLSTLTASSFHTVIVSAYAEKAIQAFEYGVLDFIAKPFTKARLEQAINKLSDRHLRQDYGIRYLSVKQTSVTQLIEINQIDFIAASGHYSEIFFNDTTRLHDKPIQKLLPLLPLNFEHIHRSYIVNMNKVRYLKNEPGSKYSLELSNGKILPISRSHYAKIKDKLDGGVIN
jgi:two-component system response regulator LytT